MRKIGLFLFVMCALFQGSFAQNVSNPKEDYEELTVPFEQSIQWNNVSKKVPLQSAWGSIDVRYDKNLPPKEVKGQAISLTAWKGERVNAQFVLWTTRELKNVKFEVQDLKAKKGSFISAANQVEAGYVRYVMTDELNKDGKGACGNREDKTAWDSSLVADVIDLKQTIDLKANSTRPAWISIQVPATVKAGTYTGTILISADGLKEQKLTLSVNVKNRTLPEAKDWGFHLDLWQNPYSVARVYGVEPWSPEHFEAMRPYMVKLAKAGQKVITASITYMPWNGQTEDPFNTMITWLKKADGTWYYDFTVFDKWVEFMMSCGITEEINCYSMIPWRMSFQYYDQATNSFKMLATSLGRDDYNQFWGNMLKAFTAHLKEKGWFDKTCIAMDERPMDQMKLAITLIKDVSPGMKISLAGSYHKEIEADLYDYCIAYQEIFPQDILEQRKAAGKKSTYYTCCSSPYPNTFTFSAPSESAFLPWLALKYDVDGYLRWAYNSWTIDPLRDSRFRTWAAGDTYMIYPGMRSSIRFERFIEGVQSYEKFRILKDEAELKRDNFRLKKLEAILKIIDSEQLPARSDDMIKKATNELNAM